MWFVCLECLVTLFGFVSSVRLTCHAGKNVNHWSSSLLSTESRLSQIGSLLSWLLLQEDHGGRLWFVWPTDNRVRCLVSGCRRHVDWYRSLRRVSAFVLVTQTSRALFRQFGIAEGRLWRDWELDAPRVTARGLQSNVGFAWQRDPPRTLWRTRQLAKPTPRHERLRSYFGT